MKHTASTQRLSKYIADGDGDYGTGSVLPADISMYDLLTVGEATGDTDLDDSEVDYSDYINILTVTAPATGLRDLHIDLDLNKTTTGWDTIVDAADTIDVCLLAQVDGTNYRGIQNATQVAAAGDGSLAENISGITFNIGCLGPNESVQVHTKLSADGRGDIEFPYRVRYIGKAPTVTPVAAG